MPYLDDYTTKVYLSGDGFDDHVATATFTAYVNRPDDTPSLKLDTLATGLRLVLNREQVLDWVGADEVAAVEACAMEHWTPSDYRCDPRENDRE
ncbi:MAG: hypothetical protein ACRCWF_05565 [Beijerinckiaceae bacterium]